MPPVLIPKLLKVKPLKETLLWTKLSVSIRFKLSDEIVAVLSILAAKFSTVIVKAPERLRASLFVKLPPVLIPKLLKVKPLKEVLLWVKSSVSIRFKLSDEIVAVLSILVAMLLLIAQLRWTTLLLILIIQELFQQIVFHRNFTHQLLLMVLLLTI